MKTVVTLLMVVLAGISTMTAQNTPKFQFKAEVIDYGEITKGSDGTRVFEFENIGNAPLIIENVYSSCGCAVPSWTKTPIAPGGKGEIVVNYNTDIVGPIRRTISIYSNADEATKAVKIKGKVLE
ncbi:MAG TPA: DUF1573 domain-containing protein [Gillisia sp.]|nr:DUF1573 domain-containing protein [Gillisia sp.]